MRAGQYVARTGYETAATEEVSARRQRV
jgi:hypothetical protein